MKTYLTVWYSSEGARTTVVAEKLRSIRFKPITGRYDYVYDWGRTVDLEEILQIGNTVHDALKA